MAKKYRSPILLDEPTEPIDPGQKSWEGIFHNIRDAKDEISTSFVYGDDNYEEEYIVPDVVEEVIAADPVAEEAPAE